MSGIGDSAGGGGGGSSAAAIEALSCVFTSQGVGGPQVRAAIFFFPAPPTGYL